MIQVKKANKHMGCNSCLNTKDVLNITIGVEMSHTTSMRLCKDCRTELMSELIKLDKEEG
jgi:hypothetical protein